MRGAKKAIVAVAHTLLTIVYHVIARREPYRELGADHFDRRRPAATADRLVRRLHRLGFEVTVTPVAPEAPTAPARELAATP